MLWEGRYAPRQGPEKSRPKPLAARTAPPTEKKTGDTEVSPADLRDKSFIVAVNKYWLMQSL